MKYVNQALLKNEEVLHVGKIHWMIYLNPLKYILFMLIPILIFDESTKGIRTFFILVLFILTIVSLINAYLEKHTTELAITNKRVIAKFGFIRRDTIELYHNQVESIIVKQGILQRILGCGTIIIKGTGGSRTPIPDIEKPLDFRRIAMETIESHNSNSEK